MQDVEKFKLQNPSIWTYVFGHNKSVMSCGTSNKNTQTAIDLIMINEGGNNHYCNGTWIIGVYLIESFIFLLTKLFPTIYI